MTNDNASPISETRFWRRNLLVIWLGYLFTAIGYSTVAPLMPIYMNRVMSLSDPAEVALWSGIAAGAAPLTVMIASPFWRWVAGRIRRGPVMFYGGAYPALTAALGVTAPGPMRAMAFGVARE